MYQSSKALQGDSAPKQLLRNRNNQNSGTKSYKKKKINVSLKEKKKETVPGSRFRSIRLKPSQNGQSAQGTKKIEKQQLKINNKNGIEKNQCCFSNFKYQEWCREKEFINGNQTHVKDYSNYNQPLDNQKMVNSIDFEFPDRNPRRISIQTSFTHNFHPQKSVILQQSLDYPSLGRVNTQNGFIPRKIVQKRYQKYQNSSPPIIRKSNSIYMVTQGPKPRQNIYKIPSKDQIKQEDITESIIPQSHHQMVKKKVSSEITVCPSSVSMYQSTNSNFRKEQQSKNIKPIQLSNAKKNQTKGLDYYKKQNSYFAKKFAQHKAHFEKFAQIQPTNEKHNQKQLKTLYQSIQKGSYIGIGRFSNVYMCLIKNINFLFAMKQIYKFTIKMNNLENQLLRQVQIQSKISHPNIISLYHFFSDQEKYYLAMEYGQTNLFKILQQRGTIPEDQCITYLWDIISGLFHLHDMGIIHRDIKPQNIIMVNNNCKIADFGWSVQIDSLSGSICGTPCYASPQILQMKNYSYKTDCWSLGILAYEIAFGKIPICTNSELDLQKIFSNLSINNNTSSLYKDLIRKLLIVNQQERISIVEAKNHLLFDR